MLRNERQPSELGDVPSDWVIRPVGEMGDVRAGKALAVNAPGEMRPYLRTMNVFDGRISLDDVLQMPMSEAEFSLYRLKYGDVLLNEGQSLELVGRCSMYRGEYRAPCGIQNALVRFRAFESTSADFAEHLFRYCQKTGVFAKIALQTTSVAHLGVSRFHNLELPWPPNDEEQKTIAEALSDVDALLDALGRMITKKRDLKQAAMQQLLTGQTRLPGFAGDNVRIVSTECGQIPSDWDVRKSGDVITEISMGPFGSDIKVSNFVAEGVPVLSGANVRTERLVDDFHNFVTPQKARSLKKAVARRGDIVVTHRGTLGQIAFIPSNSEYERYVISQSQFRVRFSEAVATPHWVVLYFQSEYGAKALLEKKGHSGVPAIAQATTTFREISIPLPSLNEQMAIAEVLSDMDAEIAALERRREKTKDLKQGMMQELLTGKTRLVG